MSWKQNSFNLGEGILTIASHLRAIYVPLFRVFCFSFDLILPHLILAKRCTCCGTCLEVCVCFLMFRIRVYVLVCDGMTTTEDSDSLFVWLVNESHILYWFLELWAKIVVTTERIFEHYLFFLYNPEFKAMWKEILAWLWKTVTFREEMRHLVCLCVLVLVCASVIWLILTVFMFWTLLDFVFAKRSRLFASSCSWVLQC